MTAELICLARNLESRNQSNSFNGAKDSHITSHLNQKKRNDIDKIYIRFYSFLIILYMHCILYFVL